MLSRRPTAPTWPTRRASVTMQSRRPSATTSISCRRPQLSAKACWVSTGFGFTETWRSIALPTYLQLYGTVSRQYSCPVQLRLSQAQRPVHDRSPPLLSSARPTSVSPGSVRSYHPAVAPPAGGSGDRVSLVPELLAALDAFVQEHRRCGELKGHMGEGRVWMT